MIKLPLGPVIPYLTLGDPTISDSIQLACEMVMAGCPVLELGLPFSDPIADGPVIQASHQRALLQSNRPVMADLFRAASAIRGVGGVAVAMSSANLVYRFGIDPFFKQSADAGLGAVLIPDLSIEDASDWISASKRVGVPLIWMVSPLISKSRLIQITSIAEGFLYIISSTGTTGMRQSVASLAPLIQAIRSMTDIPIAVGFGISTSDHVNTVLQDADAAIVGSYLVNALYEGGPTAVLQLIKDLLAGVQSV